MDAATVSVWLLNALLLGCALFALIHPLERAKLVRGFAAMRHHLGEQFIAACLGVAALALWAVIEHLGLLVGIAVAMALLIAVRAHDLGNVIPEPTELDGDVPPHAYDPEAYEAQAIETAKAERAVGAFIGHRRTIDLEEARRIYPASLTGLVGERAVTAQRDGSEL